jgi:hypothetical protein
MSPDNQGTIKVFITSPDGNVTHPFKRAETVGNVHDFAYKKLVQDKTAVPFSSTWMEYSGSAIADSESLDPLASGGANKSKEADVTLTLAWQSQGGSGLQRGIR